MTKPLLFATASLLLLSQTCLNVQVLGWSPESPSRIISRRDAFQTALVGTTNAALLLLPALAVAEEEANNNVYKYELRDRNMNKDAVIREDFWYTKGVTPPRKLYSPLVLDDPKWNAFGSCTTSGSDGSATNSCTYISLKQRQPAYSKYGFSITQGAKEFQQLKDILQAQDWNRAARYVFVDASTNLPPPPVDAQLKMVLFASAMLTSPNFSGTSRELLVARYYVNEFKFAVTEIGNAVRTQDVARAMAAWDYGKDAFNSYGQVVNRQITAKVGDPFPIIE